VGTTVPGANVRADSIPGMLNHASRQWLFVEEYGIAQGVDEPDQYRRNSLQKQNQHARSIVFCNNW